jgi:hypothetical protein
MHVLLKICCSKGCTTPVKMTKNATKKPNMKFYSEPRIRNSFNAVIFSYIYLASGGKCSKLNYIILFLSQRKLSKLRMYCSSVVGQLIMVESRGCWFGSLLTGLVFNLYKHWWPNSGFLYEINPYSLKGTV